MITTLETVPNEIFLGIFSNLCWFELLTSLSSLNNRFDLLICSILSKIDDKSNSGLVIIEPGLSFSKFNLILLPLISNPLLPFASCIRRIHFDGTNCNVSDLSSEWLFDNDKKILYFPNLKSLILTRCLLVEPLIKSLPILIKYQLDELTLSFDKDFIKLLRNPSGLSDIGMGKEKLTMLEESIRQLFSNQSRLISLQLDITCYDSYVDLHECLKPRMSLSSCSIFKQRTCCLTLRRLYTYIKYTCFLEYLIEYVPVLEQLSVHFCHSFNIWRRSAIDNDTLQTNGNWFNRMPKLESFTLDTFVKDDSEFSYLKWLMNNLNYVKKLKIHLKSGKLPERNNVIWKSVIDANFIRQYCLPDEVISLINFDFYISSECKLPMINIEAIINSFKIHPLFVDHQWTNVKCFFDPITSHQHLTSSLNGTPQFINNLINERDLFNWPHTRYVWMDLQPSLHSFLEQFNELFPNASCIKLHMENYITYDNLQLTVFKMSFASGRCRLTDYRLHNVTRLDFNPYFVRTPEVCDGSINRDTARAKILAHLISMPIQLKYLRVYQFEWLLHVILYASAELSKNALNTVQYAEFSISSCHRGSNELIRVGQNLVPFLSTYMPNLQTLRLWRPDDFPWISIRPVYKRECSYSRLVSKWYKSLQTPESIKQHVAVFQEDLSQLVKHMKELIFLDIHGEIHKEKVEPYRSMVQTLFPYSRYDVEIFRFRLWF